MDSLLIRIFGVVFTVTLFATILLAVWAGTSTAQAQWGPEKQMSRGSGDVWSFGIAADAGVLHLVWGGNPIRYRRSLDEGATWSEPRELPAALTGDRHTGRYAPDGRLFLSFRDTTRESATKGDWVGWVGTFEDIVRGREGQYRVRLMHNHVRADCAYPGVERLADGTFVATTYGHWVEDEQPFIVSVRFTLDELDERASTLGGER